MRKLRKGNARKVAIFFKHFINKLFLHVIELHFSNAVNWLIDFRRAVRFEAPVDIWRNRPITPSLNRLFNQRTTVNT